MTISDVASNPTPPQGEGHTETAGRNDANEAVDLRSRLDVTPSRIRTIQFATITTLILLSTAAQLLYLWLGDGVPGLRFVAWLLFLDGEQTIPTLYSSVVLVACAGLVALIGWGVKPAVDRMAWRALAVVFLAAGIDEFAAIHERAIEPIRDGLAISSGPLYYAWVLPGAAAVVILTAVFSGFLWRLPADTRVRYLIAGALFVGGALGFEAAGASYVSGSIGPIAPDVDPDAARSGILYVMFATIEESLELIGVAVFLTATVSHLEKHLGRRLALGPTPQGS